MAKRVTRLWRFIAAPAIILIFILSGLAMASAGAKANSPSLDVIVIDLPRVAGGDQMPGVAFMHDRHTRALAGEKDCSACHLQENDRFVFKFKRLKDGTTEADMAVYHENCVACHAETLKAGKDFGPLDGDCRSCHTTDVGGTDSENADLDGIDADGLGAWQPMTFDKSLHFRHASAKAIKPGRMYADSNCSACHHIYDETIRKTVLRKGTEQSCAYCHKDARTDTAPAIRWASHASCVACHQRFKDRLETSGPVECSGCHAAGEQAKIKRVDDVPRLDRNQPDMVLLASWMTVRGDSVPAGGLKAAMDKQMNPVAFNHVVHEAQTIGCRSCHHASLERCAQCHTEKGDSKGAGVQLAQAMHSVTSNYSCVGCHLQATAARECAGCHSLQPQKAFGQMACAQCHSVDKSQLEPLPMPAETRAAVAQNTLDGQVRAALNMAEEHIPDRVKIGGMVDEFEAVDFPHRQIVRALMSAVKENRVAAYFHRDDLTLCAGCHHNAPATLTPSKCAACHGAAFKNDQDGRPGLKGAYHGQCMGCHQAMGIEDPAATDCIKCHKKRS